jgi:hypothetical protein
MTINDADGGIGRCRSCGVYVHWAKTAKGRPHPLSAVDPGTGNVAIRDGLAIFGAPGTGNYISHFASCPEAASWRPKKPERDVVRR